MKKMIFREELAKLTPVLRDNPNAKIYVFGIGENWKYIHSRYMKVAGVDIAPEVYAFIDNDKQKQSQLFLGKPVISPENIDADSIILITAVAATEIFIRLNEMGYLYAHNYFSALYMDAILKRFVNSQTMEFQNKHRGQRCFIVGNGPSLSALDLDKLHENSECSLASNKINLLFNKTSWRPDYYFVADAIAMPPEEELCNLSSTIFADVARASEKLCRDNIFYFEQDPSPFFYNYPYNAKFNAEVAQVYYGGSITHCCMQIAAGMGFSEIYLLGMDHVFPRHISHDGNIIENGEVKAHFYKKNSVGTSSTMDLVNRSFMKAREYCEGHGIKICNATRGGALEIFERVDFDSLF